LTQQTDEKIDLLLAVDGLATSAVATGEVTTLEHKVGDDTVELGAGVTEALLASAESAEVLGSVGDNVGAQLHGDAAEGGTVDGDIEVNYWKQSTKDKERRKKKVLVDRKSCFDCDSDLHDSGLNSVHVFVATQAASSKATREQTEAHVALHNQERTRQQEETQKRG